jgi:hypothetical protein
MKNKGFTSICVEELPTGTTGKDCLLTLTVQHYGATAPEDIAAMLRQLEEQGDESPEEE